MNELPEGFVLDAPETFSELPEGFTVDVDTRIDMDAPVPPREMGGMESAVQGFRDASTFGFGNELTAAAGTAWEKIKSQDNAGDFPWAKTYQDELATAEGANVQAQAQQPEMYTGGEVLGYGANLVIPGGAGSKIAKKVGDKVVQTAISKPVAKAAKWAAESPIGQVVSDFAAPLAKKIGQKGKAGDGMGASRVKVYGSDTASGLVPPPKNILSKTVAEATIPQTAMEAVGALIGHGVVPFAGAPLGVQAVRQTASRVVGHKGLIGREGNAFAKKYGELVADWTARGTDALVANVFIKQNQDAEFRMMLKAAKEEAGKESEEN